MSSGMPTDTKQCRKIKFGEPVPDTRHLRLASKPGVNGDRYMVLSDHWLDLMRGDPDNRSRSTGMAVLAECTSPEAALAAAALLKGDPEPQAEPMTAEQCDNARMSIWITCDREGHGYKTWRDGACICDPCHRKVLELERRYEEGRS